MYSRSLYIPALASFEFTSHISNAHLVPSHCEMGVHSGPEFIIHQYIFWVVSSLDLSATSYTVSCGITEMGEEGSADTERRESN